MIVASMAHVLRVIAVKIIGIYAYATFCFLRNRTDVRKNIISHFAYSKFGHPALSEKGEFTYDSSIFH
jgi:hypothetical protein